MVVGYTLVHTKDRFLGMLTGSPHYQHELPRIPKQLDRSQNNSEF